MIKRQLELEERLYELESASHNSLNMSNHLEDMSNDAKQELLDSLLKDSFISRTVSASKTGARSDEDFLFSSWDEDEIPSGDFSAEQASVSLSDVEFSAVIPDKFIKGEYSIIELVMYEENFRHIVDEIVSSAEAKAKEIKGSAQSVALGTKVTASLSCPDLGINESEVQTWRGRYLTFTFATDVPSSYEKKQALFVITIYFDGVIATRLKFVASCTSLSSQKLELLREDVLSAFVSYSSDDRSRVATIIQGMKKVRPEMDIFFDVESLRSGVDWQKALLAEIERRDVLYLCWSTSASKSEWVDREWRYALSINGVDGIEPVPLEPPSVCPPPEELKSKHFNDRILFLIG